MEQTYLNVKYGNLSTVINMEGVGHTSDLQDRIKKKFGDDIDAPPVRIELYNEDGGKQITNLAEIPDECFKDGGLCLEIRTSPPTSRQSSVHSVVSTSGAHSSRPSSTDRWGSQLAIRLGKRDSGMEGEGINLDSRKTLKRTATTARIVSHLEKTSVLLIKSPPMTGKTSMAALVADYLYANATEKYLIINISMLDFSLTGSNWDFERAFEETLDIKWRDLASIMKHRVVYFIFDEVQIIYKRKSYESGTSSPTNNSSVVWASIKSVMSTKNSRAKFLLFAAYGSSYQNSELSTPVVFQEGTSMLGIECMKFDDDEMKEYVMKNLASIDFLRDTAFNSTKEWAIDVFCRNLKHLTGSHVGLCFSAIESINRMYLSDMKYGSYLSPVKIVMSLWGNTMFSKLLQIRALCVLNDGISNTEFDILKRLIQGYRPNYRTETISRLLQKGILTEINEEFAFSSPVMMRSFLEKIFGVSVRAQHAPIDLNELVIRVVSSIDYFQLKNSLGKTKSTGILLERAWQMQFYQTAMRCTTSDYFISADVGGFFDTTGAIDFTIHCEDMSVFWGFELLREADRIEGHIGRFMTGGRYEKLCRRFTDSCLIDFRMSKENGVQSDFSNDLNLCEKLYILSYDGSFSTFVLYSKAHPEGLKIQLPAYSQVASAPRLPI